MTTVFRFMGVMCHDKLQPTIKTNVFCLLWSIVKSWAILSEVAFIFHSFESNFKTNFERLFTVVMVMYHQEWH
jgi:hypothetical protein